MARGARCARPSSRRRAAPECASSAAVGARREATGSTPAEADRRARPVPSRPPRRPRRPRHRGSSRTTSGRARRRVRRALRRRGPSGRGPRPRRRRACACRLRPPRSRTRAWDQLSKGAEVTLPRDPPPSPPARGDSRAKSAVLARLDRIRSLQPLGDIDSWRLRRLAARIAGGDLLLRRGTVPYFVSPLYAYFLAATGPSFPVRARPPDPSRHGGRGARFLTARRLFGDAAAAGGRPLRAHGVVTFHEVLILQATLDLF